MSKKLQQTLGRRGVVAVIAAMMMVVLLGLGALAIDMSWLVSARDQLQASTDSSAISAARYIVAQGFPETTELRTSISGEGATFGYAFNQENPVEIIPTLPDIVETVLVTWAGTIYESKITGFTPSTTYYDAVHVRTTMRSAGSQDQELPGFFGAIFGTDHYEPAADAIAFFNIDGGALLPFTVRWNVWEVQADMFQPLFVDLYNGDTGAKVSDGLPEVSFYPWKFSSVIGSNCPGNFGTLNVGINNQGLPGVAAQIRYGVTFEELGLELGGIQEGLELINADDGWQANDLVTTSGSAIVTSASADFLDPANPVIPGTHRLDIGQGGGSGVDTLGTADVGFHNIVNVISATQLQLAAPLTVSKPLPGIWYRIEDPDVGWDMTGNPGMSVGQPLKDALDDRIGDIVGIFIHDDCQNGGSNATYDILYVRYGKLLAYKLNGTPSGRFITLQPVPPPDPSELEGHITYMGLGR